MIDAVPAGERRSEPVEGSPRLGLIRNPQSLRNRRRAEDAYVAAPAGVLEAEPRSLDETAATLAGYARLGIGHLVVDGGDGTLREILSLLPSIYGDLLPTITLLTGGNTNLTAVDVGHGGHGPEALPRLLAGLAAGGGTRTRRRPVKVSWPDGSQPPRLAFFVGCAGFHRGWKLATGEVHEKGFMHGPAVAAAIAGAAWQTLAGGANSAWRRGEELELRIDDAAPIGGAHFLFATTTLHRLYRRLWPFWDHGDAALRWLDIAAPPPKFGRALPALLRGEPKPWMRDSGAYRSGGAQRIRLRLSSPIVVDGEAHAPGADGLIELTPGPELEFYAP